MKCILLYNIQGFKIQTQSAEFNTTIAITIIPMPDNPTVEERRKNRIHSDGYLKIIAKLTLGLKKSHFFLLFLTKLFTSSKIYAFLFYT